MDLYDKLVDYSQSDVYPFHMPGHKIRFYRNFLIHMPLILRRLMDLIIYTMRKGSFGSPWTGRQRCTGQTGVIIWSMEAAVGF